MTRGRFAVHGHFYQPPREDPFTGCVPADPGARPAHDWNERVAAECYAPNAKLGNFGRIGWDFGPALATWLRREHPDVHAAIVAQAAANPAAVLAMGYHHAILPLAPARDRRTEIRWGLRDAELRFGHRPDGLWLPETAVDLLTLRIAAEEGVRFTILAPWQASDPDVDTRRLYRVEVGGGHHLVVCFYDRSISSTLSFDPGATADADRFATDRIAPRLAEPLPSGAPALCLAATDGELYGHHQKFRDRFLARLTTLPEPERPFDLATLGALVADARLGRLPIMSIRDRTSWSCLHGVARWTAECPDAPDGRWKGPLRAALNRLAAAMDALAEREAARHGLDLWAARQVWVDVASEFAEARPTIAGLASGRAARHSLETLLRAQEARLAMFASDAWFWDDPARPETAQGLRFAGRAAQLMDELLGSHLEAELVANLAALRSPATGRDGTALYRRAITSATPS